MKFVVYLSVLCALITACSVQAGNQPALQHAENADTEESKSSREFYGPNENNYLIIYPVNGEKPAPVYLWGHANSDGKTPPSAEDISPAMVKRLNEQGIAVVSWESVPQVKTLHDVEICERDLEAVYAWLLKNAKQYNLDMDNLFIGGMSRGSVVSWKFANEKPGRVRGVFYAQGLPKGAWADGKERPLAYVTIQSPPVVFTYRDGMNTTDGHSPRFGQRIVNRYQELGIGDRAVLYHSQGKSLYTQAPEFIIQHLK